MSIIHDIIYVGLPLLANLCSVLYMYNYFYYAEIVLYYDNNVYTRDTCISMFGARVFCN
jgi:hypothetical protein